MKNDFNQWLKKIVRTKNGKHLLIDTSSVNHRGEEK